MLYSIVLAVTMCSPAAGGILDCQEYDQQSWIDTYTQGNLASDWDACLEKQTKAMQSPSTLQAFCLFEEVEGQLL